MVYPRRHTGSMWNNSLHPTNRHRHSDYRDISKKSRYRNSWSEVIKFGHSELLVLTVPGHSPGSVAFYNKKNGFAIVGDALFAGSIGRTDLWGGNQEVLIAAINDKLLSLPDETVIYPGHGPETRVIDEKLNNPYL